MSWKRHFRVIKSSPQPVQNPLDANRWGGGSGVNSNLASYLPLVYAGHPNRIQRYYQFDDMDRDSDINAALDTIADFCTQSEEQTDEPFEIHYNTDPNESETKIIKTMLDKWVKLNTFRSRLWYMFRDTLKNGDAFYLRDPETQEWLWLDHFMVEMVKVGDTLGKKPEEYLVRGLDYNRQAKFATKKADPNQYRTPYGTSNIGASRVAAVPASTGPAAFSLAGTAADPRQRHMMGPFAQEVSVLDAQFVVHLSLSIGNDINWPFGPSILEPIFKTFKQKELLEDAIIIYRVQRAPERRIFYIDTGTMPPERAKRHIEAIKNDIHQRRIPNRTGTGGCFDMATRVPLLDGRTLSIAELAAAHEAGKENWVYSCDPTSGEIVPGKITWAGTTRRDAEVVRLTLDNGQTITCTPDHKFPIFGRGKTEAKDIQVGMDSLISFNTRLESISKYREGPQYQQVYDHAAKDWKFTHRMVGEFMKARGQHNELDYSTLTEKKTVIHHDDFNKYNNHPSNLFYMNGYDHFLLHAEKTSQYLESLSEEERQVLIGRRAMGGLRSWANANSERREAARHRFMKACAEQQKKPWVNQPNVWNQDLFDILVATVKANSRGKRQTAAALSSNNAFMTLYRELNRPKGNTIVHLDYNKLSVSSLEKLIRHYGFSGWTDFLHSCGFQIKKPSLGLKTDQHLLSAIVETAKGMDVPNKTNICFRLSKDESFMSYFAALNAETKGMSNKSMISINTLNVVLGKHGYASWTEFCQNLSCFNHKVVNVEYLTKTMDVGTLTIDGQEEYHGFHTFALEQGVFAFNSILDAAYNPLCISLDTRIHLTDGRILALSDLIDEYERGIENWVYSCDPRSGRIVEGPISWAGVTKKDAEVVQVTLDNDKSFVCTADHKIPVLGKGFVQAGELSQHDPLIRLNRNTGIAHYATKVEHLKERITVGTITVDRDEEYHPFHTFAIEQNIFLKNSINDDYFFAQCLHLDTDIPLLDGRVLTLSEIIRKYEAGEVNWTYSYNAQTGETEKGRISWAGVTRKDADLIRVTLDNGSFVDATPDHRFILANGGERVAGDLQPDDLLLSLVKLVQHEEDFVQHHRVVSVETLNDTADTGDITVESASGSHVFALAAGIYVHNSQDGRGSKVETLPGGEQTGEITDLMFFSRKLARGLRVPTSYLNLGEDEGNNSVTFNDGKLGAAMIQEFRFSKFCQRLQSLLGPAFDDEFKRFMIKNGIEMEWSLFEIRFTPPQSFTRYRQIELDSQRMQVYSGIAENRRLSERFKLTRYLGLSEDELIENEKLWSEENAAKLKVKTGASPAETGGGDDLGLGAVGIRPGDEGMPPDMEMPSEEGAEGAAGAGMPGGPGGAPGAAAPPGAGPAAGAGGGGMPPAV